MKNTYSILLIAALALNLVIPSHIAAAEQNTSYAQQIVADVFKAHTNDRVRLQILRKWFVDNLYKDGHNWFQRVRNMTVQEEQQLIQEYADYQESLEPIHKAIKFLEDKLEFEDEAYRERTRQEYAQEKAQKEQEKIEQKQVAADAIANCAMLAVVEEKQPEKDASKASLKTVALVTGVAGLAVCYGYGLYKGVLDVPFI